MACWPKRSNRIQDESHLEIDSFESDSSVDLKHKEASLSDSNKGFEKSTVLGSGGKLVQRWNMLLFSAAMISLLVDPIFFLLPEARSEMCVQFSNTLKVVLTVARSLTDVFYVSHICLRFRTTYTEPSFHGLARGELVTDPWQVPLKYFRFGFWVDLAAAFPLPQVLLWGVMPNLKASLTSNSKTYLMFIILIQMLLRFSLAYPLSLEVAKSSGIITETAWVAAAYNLMFYILASIVSGNCWYLLSIQRQETCWRTACSQETACVYEYLDCNSLGDQSRAAWLQSTNVTNNCNPANNLFPYGIFSYAITVDISSGGFFNKFFCCLWWGIRNLSSQGQNLLTSIYLIENIFSYLVGALGLVLFAFFIGNMQKYIQADYTRLEEWRIKRTDLEQWMHHRQLPRELRHSVLHYHKYKWIATQGVDEQDVLVGLPTYLRRQTKRYLCFTLIQQVPLLDQLDNQTLGAICERLKPVLYTQGMYLLYEGDRVHEMLFIIRGHIYSYTTDGGRTGFFNSSVLGPKDMCGEELLMWVLDKRQVDVLPSSTRTLKALSDIEGFSIGAEDLRFIGLQFKRMQSREVRHKLRFYSQPWRIWAASFIQAAWRHHKREKEAASQLQQFSSSTKYEDVDMFVPRPDAGIEAYAARLIADMRQGGSKRFDSE
ncbi:CNGC15c-like protein [Drosera capensis]